MSRIINGQEYLTIKEFAEAIGYTPQALYKQLNNPLNPLNLSVERVKSIKYLPKSLISSYIESTEKENSLNSLNENLNPLNQNLNSLNPKTTAPTDETAPKITEEIIEMLRAELDTKNKQIEELNNRLAETTKALQREQELNHRQQELTAKNILLLEEAEKKKENIFKRIFKKKEKEE